MRTRKRQLGGPASLVVLALTAACTMIGHQKVSGWPRLAVTEHYVPEKVMRDKCVKYVGFGMSPLACAEYNFAKRTCDIWYSSTFPPTKDIIEHERLHCRGYDHIGGGSMAAALKAWNAAQRSASTGGG